MSRFCAVASERGVLAGGLLFKASKAFIAVSLPRASEFLKSLENDTGWVAKRKAASERIAQKEALLEKDQQPVLVDLRAVGFNYSSLWKMQNSPGPYKGALLILLKHLGRDYMDATRATIARCFAVKDSGQFFEFLIDAYRQEPLYVDGKLSATKDGLAIAIAAASTSNNIAEIIDLPENRELGRSRIFLLIQLCRRVKKDVVRAALQKLMSNPDLEKEIKSWKAWRS